MTRDYVEPEDLHTAGAKVLKVLKNQGKSKIGDFKYSLALVDWSGEGPGHRYAIRWNGTDDRIGGFPSVGDTGMWFILPREIEIKVFLRSLGFTEPNVSRMLSE